jgi:predicted outer membrane repeat protein
MKKIYLFLTIALVFSCSIAVVSAEDTNATDVIQLAEDTSSDQETNIILQTDDEINDDANQEDILGAPTGTFFELQKIIDSVPEESWFSISKDYCAADDLKTLTIEKSITFKGNGHTLDGKLLDRIMSVSLNSEQTVVLENLNFINGKLSWTNGAGLYASGGAVTLVNCTFKDNQGGFTLDGKGGALYAKDCELRVLNSVFDHNHFERDTATLLYGGAIGVKGGSCIILDSVFKNNIAEQGGAIWADTALHVERCDFINNTCNFNGAIYSENNADIICCNFIGNKAMFTGSSICISGGDKSTIDSCNFIGDRVDNPGYQDMGDTINVMNQYIGKDGATVFITNCTFTDQVKNACIVSNYRAKNVIANNNWWGNTDQNKNEKPKVRGNVVVDDWYYLGFNNTYYMPNEKTPIELSLKSVKDNSQKDIPSIYAISNIKATNATVTQAGKYSLYYEPSLNSDKGSIDLTLYDYSYNNRFLEFIFMHDVKEVTVHNYNELADALENAQKQVAPNCIINLAEGNYKATKNIVLGESAGLKNLVINGNNNVLDGNNVYSFLKVIGFLTSLNGLKVTISDATFKNFNAQGIDGSVLSMSMGYGEATLNNVKFIDNTARNGGALSFAVLSNVNINGCDFIKNSATADGGAVYVDSINFNINDTTFTQNSAKNKGGAVYESVRTTNIDNSKFLENTASRGGALYYSTGTVTCTGSEFIKNVATDDAGAVYRNGPFNDYNNVFRDNSPDDFDYTGSDEEDDTDSPSDSGDSGYSGDSGSNKGYRSIDKITVGNHQISISNNKLTLGVLNQIFNKDFRNGHLLVYIDGKLVFNATTTDNLLQIIFDLLNLLSGNHEIKVVFTDNGGNTNTYTENITI